MQNIKSVNWNRSWIKIKTAVYLHTCNGLPGPGPLVMPFLETIICPLFIWGLATRTLLSPGLMVDPVETTVYVKPWGKDCCCNWLVGTSLNWLEGIDTVFVDACGVTSSSSSRSTTSMTFFSWDAAALGLGVLGNPFEIIWKEREIC